MIVYFRCEREGGRFVASWRAFGYPEQTHSVVGPSAAQAIGKAVMQALEASERLSFSVVFDRCRRCEAPVTGKCGCDERSEDTAGVEPVVEPGERERG